MQPLILRVELDATPALLGLMERILAALLPLAPPPALPSPAAAIAPIAATPAPPAAVEQSIASPDSTPPALDPSPAPAARVPSPRKGKPVGLPLWTEERNAIIRRDWPTQRTTAAIFEEVNALPGPPVSAAGRISIQAHKLGVGRPPRQRPSVEPATPAEITPQPPAPAIAAPSLAEVDKPAPEPLPEASPPPAPVPNQVPQPSAPVQQAPQEADDDDLPAPPVRAVFRPRQSEPCAWPLPRAPGAVGPALSCDEPSVHGKPYCLEHCIQAYPKFQPPTEKAA